MIEIKELPGSGTMSYLYVIIQIVMIVVIGVTGPIIPQSPVFLGGAILGVFADALGVMDDAVE